MPRLRPAPNEKQEPVIQHFDEAPTEAIEIELPDDDIVEPTEVDITPAPKEEPKPKPEPTEDNPLQRALDAQQRAEELQRTAQRERDEAVRRSREHEVELTRERGERQDAEYNSVLTAIAAEQSSLEKAESDYAAFAAAGDWGNAAKAQRIMASAASRVDRLEESKQVFEKTKKEEPTQRPAPAPAAQDFEQKIASLPDTAKTWLRKHPEYMNDTALNRKIQAAHGTIVELEGVEAFSPAYFDALDTRFGFKAPPPKEEPKPQPGKQRSIPMTAPPSREVPSASGQRSKPGTMTLSPEERLIARTSIMDRPGLPNMTNAEKEFLYAKNKARLHKMRASGEYRHTTEETG